MEPPQETLLAAYRAELRPCLYLCLCLYPGDGQSDHDLCHRLGLCQIDESLCDLYLIQLEVEPNDQVEHQEREAVDPAEGSQVDRQVDSQVALLVVDQELLLEEVDVQHTKVVATPCNPSVVVGKAPKEHLVGACHKRHLEEVELLV